MASDSEPAHTGSPAGAPAHDAWPWWLLPVVICALGLCFSFVQPSFAIGRDIRNEAAWSLVDWHRTYFGDPGPAVEAARRLSSHAHAPLYSRDLTVGSAFIYPPVAARLYQWLAPLPEHVARERLAIANHVLFAGILLLLLRVATFRTRPAPAIIAATLAGALVFYPLLHAVELNQATVLITLLFGASVAALQADSPILGGVLFGLTFALKPQLALALPLLVWHGRRTLVAAAATGSGLLAVSLATAGLDNHVDYLTRVLPTLARGYAYYANQSLNGLFHRMFYGGTISVFELPPDSPAVRGLTMAAGIAAYGGALALVHRWRARREVGLWVLAFAWLVATVVSPVAWQHHYAPAVFVFALVLRAIAAEPRLQAARVTGPLAVAFVLMAGYFEVRGLDGWGARLAVSYVLAGAGVLAGVVARVFGPQQAED